MKVYSMQMASEQLKVAISETRSKQQDSSHNR